MTAIFKREFSSYYKGTMGYIFAAVLIFMIGLFASAINLAGLVSGFEFSLYNGCFVYLIIIPLLTMKTLAEEKRNKTDQLLYSLPLTGVKIVLGKYLAMLAVLALPLAVLAFFPLVLCLFGEVNLLVAYSSLAAFFLLGAALTAIGMFISALTENQIIAAVISFFVLLLGYFMSSISELLPSTAESSMVAFIAAALAVSGVFYLLTKKSAVSLLIWSVCMIVLLLLYFLVPAVLEGSFQSLVSYIGLFDRFYSFVNGMLDLEAIVYYISVSFLFIFFTVSAVEKRRWS